MVADDPATHKEEKKKKHLTDISLCSRSRVFDKYVSNEVYIITLVQVIFILYRASCQQETLKY